jgi:hypothetical protein
MSIWLRSPHGTFSSLMPVECPKTIRKVIARSEWNRICDHDQWLADFGDLIRFPSETVIVQTNDSLAISGKSAYATIRMTTKLTRFITATTIR